MYVKGSLIPHTAGNVRDTNAKCRNALNQTAHFSYEWFLMTLCDINVVPFKIK